MLSYEHAEHRVHMEQRFMDSAKDPFSHTSNWITLGVNRGLTPDTEEGRLGFARELSAVMSIVLPLGQDELFREELNLDEVARVLKQDRIRVEEVVNCMVDGGAIVSLARRRQRGSTWARMAR